ncbi:hypothetical protein [Kitasatospora sp. NPDC101183]|uniref:hypothetical protein n=1 Tax=Kitasatospora sp. NPDC101183 TaxID=3364100 RepID=UPI00382BAC8D
MDDALTLLRRAVDLLPEGAEAENGWTVGHVREEIAFQEWELALGLAPLRPERWRHLRPGDVIAMHEGRPVVGLAEVVEVLPPRV